MATHVNRFVVGPNAEGRSTVLQHGLTNVQSREGFYWRATLWATQETPVDNSIDGDRSQTEGLGASREPFPNGMICRAMESRITPIKTSTAASWPISTKRCIRSTSPAKPISPAIRACTAPTHSTA